MKRKVSTGRISVYQFSHSFLYGKILASKYLLTKILPYKGIHNKNKLNGQLFFNEPVLSPPIPAPNCVNIFDKTYSL